MIFVNLDRVFYKCRQSYIFFIYLIENSLWYISLSFNFYYFCSHESAEVFSFVFWSFLPTSHLTYVKLKLFDDFWNKLVYLFVTYGYTMLRGSTNPIPSKLDIKRS